MKYYILEGNNKHRNLPYMTNGEYYTGYTYRYDGELYASFTNYKSEAKKYKTIHGALKGKEMLENKTANCNKVKINEILDEKEVKNYEISKK